jgi:hypothetical protein
MRQLRNWFFQITATATKRGTRLNNGDKPTSETFKALVESTVFKTEADDRARENDLGATLSDLNGHVVASTDVEAKNNAAKPEDRTLVVQPSQLPVVDASSSMTISSVEAPELDFDDTILETEIDPDDTAKNRFLIKITDALTAWFQSVVNYIGEIRSDFDTHIGPLDPGATISSIGTFQELKERVKTNEDNILGLSRFCNDVGKEYCSYRLFNVRWWNIFNI